MADRYEKSFTRKPNPVDTASSRSQSSDDPLAELARIVSGNQSFDDLVGRSAPTQPAPRQAAPAAPAQRAPSRDFSFDLESELLNDLQSSFDPNARSAPPRAPEPAPRQPAPPSRQPQPQPQSQGFDDMRLRGAAPPPPRPAAQPAGWASSRPAAPADDDPYAGTAYSSGDYDRPADPFAARRPASPAAPARAPAPPPAPEPAAAGGYDDDYYYDETAEQPYDEGDYSEESFAEYDGYGAQPPRRSRKLLIGAAIVLAVLLAGGLVALALKDNGSLTTASAPQVIDADPNPTKVQPAVQPTDADGQQNKVIFDRANPDSAPQEQLVLPDDGAVDTAPAANESAASRQISRIILPGAPGDSSSAPAVSDGSSDAADQASEDDSAPRKVRTVVIKPDGTIVSSQARAKGAPDAAADAAPAPVADAAPAPAADGAAAAAPEPLLPDVVPPTPAREPSAAVAAAPQADPPAMQKDNSQLEAPVAAPKAAARPAPVQSAPSSGGFVVQVTSQRSEDQAVAAFRALQRKFPDILGNRSPDIARADLGAKGVYYRVRVGPTATRDESISICEALKAAGGDCIVQKN